MTKVEDSGRGAPGPVPCFSAMTWVEDRPARATLQSRPMIHAIWEFRVSPEFVAEFECNYGPDGEWAQLFRRSPAYHGTELLRDQDDPLRFVTVDKWEDLASYSAMREEKEYALLDIACEKLVVSERLIGIFELL
jgi:quinol monooxygenase YgiN